MAYPIIVSKADLNTPLAYLNNIENDNCLLSQIINGENMLKFTAVIEELKTEFLYDENNVILIDDDLYKPLILEEEHSEKGLLTIYVECEHISYELLETPFDNFSYSNKDISTVMNNCLLGTGFTFAGTDVTLKTDINYTEECNARQILIAIANNWKAELKFKKYDIYAYKQIGENRGVDFRFGKNLTGLKRTIDRSKKDEKGNPAVTYEISVADLVLLNNEFTELEYFELGDTVRIVDTALKIEVYKRIVALERNVLSGKNTSLTLGDFSEDIRRTVSGIKQQAEDTAAVIKDSAPDWDKIKEITDNLGNVIADKLSGTLQLMATQIQNSTSTMEITDNGILFHNQPTEAVSTFACFLNSSGILFANEKNTDGSWKWQTALSAEGLTATKVLASALYGLTMQAVTITAGTINGGTINGVTIEGSTIYSGDRQSGNYVAIDSTGTISVYHKGVRTYLLSSNNAAGSIALYDADDIENSLRISSVYDYNNVKRQYIRASRGLVIDSGYSFKVLVNGNEVINHE